MDMYFIRIHPLILTSDKIEFIHVQKNVHKLLLRTLNITVGICPRNFNILSIKYQPYPKSIKIVGFE